MRVILALGLLMLLPAASAGQVVWHGPDEALAGAPVFAAYTIEEGDGLEGHVNIRLEAWLDGHLLLETDSVHEHDGAYTTVVTPPAPGTLRLVAVREGEETVHETAVAAAPTGDLEGAELAHSVSQYTPSANGSFLALVEATLADGGLVLSAWTAGPMALLPFEEPGEVRALFAPAGNAVFGAQWIASELPSYGSAIAGFGTVPLTENLCGSRVVLDPNSAAADALAWQAETNIRVMVADAGAPITYTLTSAHPFGPGLPRDVQFSATSADPFAGLTFRPGQVGPHWLAVAGDGLDCAVPFHVLPAAEGEGTVEADIKVNGTTVDVGFRPVSADGSVLGHYEFDTRVVRIQDDAPGRLAWSGKMHGHGGDVRFRLHNLEPGTYEIVTHPSPQSSSTPGVASEDGFRYTFAVASAEGSSAPWLHEEPLEDDTDQEASAASLAVLALACLAVARLRRR